MYGNGLLGSSKPWHIELSDRSDVKKTDDGYQGDGCPYWISTLNDPRPPNFLHLAP